MYDGGKIFEEEQAKNLRLLAKQVLTKSIQGCRSAPYFQNRRKPQTLGVPSVYGFESFLQYCLSRDPFFLDNRPVQPPRNPRVEDVSRTHSPMRRFFASFRIYGKQHRKNSRPFKNPIIASQNRSSQIYVVFVWGTGARTSPAAGRNENS